MREQEGMKLELTNALGKAIRKPAEDLYNEAMDRDGLPSQTLRDVRDLTLGLARAIERGYLTAEQIHGVLGAPGDWGYGTAIGDALAGLYRDPEMITADRARERCRRAAYLGAAILRSLLEDARDGAPTARTKAILEGQHWMSIYPGPESCRACPAARGCRQEQLFRSADGIRTSARTEATHREATHSQSNGAPQRQPPCDTPSQSQKPDGSEHPAEARRTGLHQSLTPPQGDCTLRNHPPVDQPDHPIASDSASHRSFRSDPETGIQSTADGGNKQPQGA